MADVVASGVLNSLLDRLRDRITSEFGQLMDVGTELKKLAGTLSAIRDVLEDAEAQQVQEKALRGWLRRLKDVAYDIDDLLDGGLAKNRKRGLTDPESSTASWMKGTVSKVLSLPSSVISQLKITREIREIRERLDELAEEKSKFHLRERSIVTCCRQENAARGETGSSVIESEVFGREEDKKKIVEYLVDASGGDLGIVAITTLAQLVYNDQQISNHFEKKIWVQVAYLMATAEPHYLKALYEDDCWLLFEKRAFGVGACEKTKKLVAIGKEIVKKCGGIPLAAKALGSLMHSKRRESDWSAVRDNDIWNLEENEILPALSYAGFEGNTRKNFVKH
ncbi:putative disease resistance protein RGA3 [Ananas comosus]|uniref:Putative disease resistance protein RGA3 n=1 Tax=Ananas comosus TaxID=4615 RepID=A0A199V7S6_ANACO|nr:putative disease resistance protein RGA3 [Ananas comosus]